MTNVAHAVDGDLDPTFGEGGTVITDFSRSFQIFDFAILRYDSNGNMLQIDSLTGEYKFTACGASLILAGAGSVKVKGCKITLSMR